MEKEVTNSSEKEKHPIIKKKIKQSLDLSIKEGSYASVSSALGVSYFSPFALALGANSSQIGILSAFTNLLPGISQLIQSKKQYKKKISNKKILIQNAFLSYFLMFFLIALGVFYILGYNFVVWGTILILGLFYYFFGIMDSSWFILMGTLVPENKRGTYFSKRNRTIQFFGMIAMIVSAYLLDISTKHGSIIGQVTTYTIFCFCFLFFMSFLFRLKSIQLLKKQYEPRIRIKKKEKRSLKNFLKEIKKTPFGNFAIYYAVFKFSMAIANPFFVVYILNELKFSYTLFILTNISIILFNVLFFPIIGKIADNYGNIALIKISSIFISLVPLSWILTLFFNESFYLLKIYAIIVPGLLFGFGGVGLELAARNYIYDTNNHERRMYALSYLNLLTGVLIFIGSLIGSLLTFVKIPFVSTLIFIFSISFLLRFIIAIWGSNKLQEIRVVPNFKAKYILREIYPIKELYQSLNKINNNNIEVIHKT